MQRVISPERGDAYDGKTPARSYKDIMLAQELRKEEAEVRKAIAKQADKENGQGGDSSLAVMQASVVQTVDYSTAERKRRRWDDDSSGTGDETPVVSRSDWDNVNATPVVRRGGEETPGGSMLVPSSAKTPSSRWDVTPAAGAATPGNATGPRTARSRWDETPVSEEASRQAGRWDAAATPATVTVTDAGAKKRSRWDETPMAPAETPNGAHMMGATPGPTPMGRYIYLYMFICRGEYVCMQI